MLKYLNQSVLTIQNKTSNFSYTAVLSACCSINCNLSIYKAISQNAQRNRKNPY